MNVKTNGEKEWLRKMNGGMPMCKDTSPAPVRAEAAQKESKPMKNERAEDSETLLEWTT